MDINQNLKEVDLLDESEEASTSSSLPLIKIGPDEIIFSPFMTKSIEVHLHYDPFIGRYVQCNGKDCYLCAIGRNLVKKLLLPVYLPLSSEVGILPIAKSTRPFDLLPQIRAILKSGKRLAVFASYIDRKYHVKTRELTEELDPGAEAIKAFLANQKGEELQLTPMYDRIPNEDLLEIPEIAAALRLKGKI